jgi:quercetin dioxygenase-like cupin family protein
MQTMIEMVRQFARDSHIANILEGEWTVMIDDLGNQLSGIRGRAGVALPTVEGIEIGADLIEMQTGSTFPLHTHPGEHILYVIRGQGFVHVDGIDHPIHRGDTIFVPAEYPHGVKTKDNCADPLLLLAFGYPHKNIGAQDRMRVVTQVSANNHIC